MRKLIESEIARKRKMVDDYHVTKKAWQSDLDEAKSQVKRLKHQIKEAERDMAALMDEITSGETHQDQMELPR